MMCVIQHHMKIVAVPPTNPGLQIIYLYGEMFIRKRCISRGRSSITWPYCSTEQPITLNKRIKWYVLLSYNLVDNDDIQSWTKTDH